MTAAAAATQFRTYDRDDFDPLFAQQGVGVGVPIVREDDARRGAHDICAAIPLRAFALIIAASRLDHTHLLESQRLGHDVDEGLLIFVELDTTWMIARVIRIGPGLVQ